LRRDVAARVHAGEPLTNPREAPAAATAACWPRGGPWSAI